MPPSILSKEACGTIYVLKCAASKFYVGYTRKPVKTRIQKHFEGKGSQWTRMYSPIETIETFPGDTFDEDSTTKRYMAKYGISNVRGGSYCQISLPSEQTKALEKELKSGAETCFGCGQPGHFIGTCPRARSAAPPRLSSCNDTLHIKNDVDYTPVEVCARCGRYTHTEDTCYAKTHLNGKSLTNDTKPVDDNEQNSSPNRVHTHKRLAGKIDKLVGTRNMMSDASSTSDASNTSITSTAVTAEVDEFQMSTIIPNKIELEVEPTGSDGNGSDADTNESKCERCGRLPHSFGCFYTHDVYSNPIGIPIITKTLNTLSILKNLLWRN